MFQESVVVKVWVKGMPCDMGKKTTPAIKNNGKLRFDDTYVPSTTELLVYLWPEDIRVYYLCHVLPE